MIFIRYFFIIEIYIICQGATAASKALLDVLQQLKWDPVTLTNNLRWSRILLYAVRKCYIHFENVIEFNTIVLLHILELKSI